MFRDLDRARMERMRIWTPPDSPDAPLDTASICIEWGGRIGHPSSYGLLGGRLIEGETEILLPVNGRSFPDALAAGLERVDFGLRAEYRPGILAAAPLGLAISVAAQGNVSSSQMAFEWLTVFLVDLLRVGIPDGVEDIWLKFAEAQTRRGGQLA